MHFEYMNAVADSATLDIKLAETINARGHSATLVKGHPIGALSLPLKELLAAQKAYNQAVVDELMPEASILRQYHPMVNGDGCVCLRCKAVPRHSLSAVVSQLLWWDRNSPWAPDSALSRPTRVLH